MTKYMSKGQISDPATMKRRNDNYLKKKRNASKNEDDDGSLSAQANKILEISPHADHTGTPDTPSTALPTPNMPFKTQRQVLTTVQELLEESCFDFAQQWLPDVLKDKNIKEAEQAELTEWSNIMGKEVKTLPKHATQRIAGTSLTQELTATHQLRNAAVYRENVSVARMLELLEAARNLVTIMKDEKRIGVIEELIGMIEQNASHLKDYHASIQAQLSVDLAVIETKRKTLDRLTEERIEEARRKNEDNCTAFGTTLETFLDDSKYGAPANRKSTQVKKPERQHAINLTTPTSVAGLGTRFSSTLTSPVSITGRNPFEAAADPPLQSENPQFGFKSRNSVAAEAPMPPGNHGSSFAQAARGVNSAKEPAPFNFGADIPTTTAFAPLGVDGGPLTFGQYTASASRKPSSTAVPISLAEAPKTIRISSESGDVFVSPPSDTPNADTSEMQALPSSPSSSLSAIFSALQGTEWWLSSANSTSSATANPVSSASPASVPGSTRPLVCRGTNQGPFRPKVYELSGESDEHEECGQSITFMPAYRGFSFEVRLLSAVHQALLCHDTNN